MIPSTPDSPKTPISPIVRFNCGATALFMVTAVVAAVVFDDFTKVLIVVVSVALFAIGVATFLLGYFAAVQRSREEEISVTQLFFMVGTVADKRAKQLMNGCLFLQTSVGVAAAIARPSTDGKAGSVLAFGVMVPMLGLGLNGLWVSRHGTFGPRRLREQSDSVDDETHPDQ
jgi:MFS family permease